MNSQKDITKSQLVIIGIDGATFDILQPLIKNNRLPTIAKLMREGVRAQLRSTLPPVSPVAWTSMVTGKHPGSHGIFDFLGRNTGTYTVRYNNSTYRRSEPLWNILSKAGKSVGVVNITMSYPPDEVNGFMLSGVGTPHIDSVFSHPAELCTELQKRFGPYIFSTRVPFSKGIDKFIAGLHDEIDYRLKTVEYLIGRHSCDFLFVLFNATDGASHFLWKFQDPKHPEYSFSIPEKYRQAIENIYEHVDQALCQLLDHFNASTNIMIVSDHGFGPAYKLLNLNNWLEKHGYLAYRRQAKQDSITSRGWSFIKQLIGTVTPEYLKQRHRSARRHKHRVNSSLKTLEVMDWSRTKAFSAGSVGNIFLNIKARDPLGIVSAGEEADRLGDEIAQKLRALTDPETGEPVVEAVFRRQQVFRESFRQEAPELLVCLRKGFSFYHDIENTDSMGGIAKDVLTKSHRWSGEHDLNGILLLHGPGVRRGVELDTANIVDVAPTALYVMELPIPQDMEGQVLKAAFEVDRLLTNPPEYASIERQTQMDDVADYTEEDSELVKERLRQLGYL